MAVSVPWLRLSTFLLNFGVVDVWAGAGPSLTSHPTRGIFSSQILMVALVEATTSAFSPLGHGLAKVTPFKEALHSDTATDIAPILDPTEAIPRPAL